MKKTLLMLSLLAAGVCGAQTVNIPDINFKNYLLNYTPAIDSDGDNEIQVSEALAVMGLFITQTSGQPITNLEGLEAFVNLQNIGLNYVNLESASFNTLSNLEEVSIYGNIDNLDLSNLLNVTYIGLTGDFATVNITGCVSLVDIQINNFAFGGTTELVMENNINMKSFSFKEIHKV